MTQYGETKHKTKQKKPVKLWRHPGVDKELEALYQAMLSKHAKSKEYFNTNKNSKS